MTHYKSTQTVLVTGGAGYIGSVLVPRLVNLGYKVKVLDLFIYGDDTLDEVKDNPNLELIKGDIRDQNILNKIMTGCDSVIHLACISNDPSVELDPSLSGSINYEAFEPLLKISKNRGVKRFIFASSGSIYGISDAKNITEDHPLVPVSLYNIYKAKCEKVLQKYQSKDFATIIIRPATVCGYSTRQRLDLSVNILTNHAVNRGKITVFGGTQMRPNIHIKDMVDLYTKLLKYPEKLITGKTFNAGFENYSITQIAKIVKEIVQGEVTSKEEIEIEVKPSDDIRSYHVSSNKIRRELGFEPKYGVRDGVLDLIKAFKEDKIPLPMTDIRYYNIDLMKHIKLN